MTHQGPSFYDDAGVFDTYAGRRSRGDSANDTLERPVIRELVDDVRALDVLDLGCGNASFAIELLAAGAKSYVGVDGSARMIASSTIASLPKVTLVHANLVSWSMPIAAFDLVTARLVLHYLADVPSLFERVRQALRPGGRFVFSVEHPVITSNNRSLGADGRRHDWIVDDYFDTGEREVDWLGSRVVKHHRTVEDYFAGLQGNGFDVIALRESKPRPEHFRDPLNYQRRMRIPLFLMMSARVR